MRRKTLIAGSCSILASSLMFSGCTGNKTEKHDTGDSFKGVIGRYFEDSREWWPEKGRAPENAPNVVMIMLDDAGYGTASVFGGLMETPVFDSLANNGLRYTNFHSTGVCGPSRAALLTGRNHHSVGMGWLNYSAMGFPGYNSILPDDKATLTEVLHENHYNSYMVGKWHLTPINEITSVGPFDRWPLGKGFDHFYGFHLGHTDQYHPCLYEDNQVINIEPNTTHLTTLLANRAIKYIANQKSLNPENPFFLYFATGAIHTPHQVDKKYSDMYKGRFDRGWDWYRQEVFERQKKLGVIPANAVLPDRDPTIPAWDSLSPEQKKASLERMEIYAGFMTHADYEFGRILNFICEIGELDNTMVIVIVGDNGSAQGTPHSGWTQATNTPFRRWKVDANNEGGVHQPLVIYYPKMISEKGGIRNQYCHLIDIMPTILEATGAKIPETIDGHIQKPLEGISLVYSFNEAAAPTKRTTQYYELLGKRAIYHEGWKAAVYHESGKDFKQDVWELYNLDEDFNERLDLADKYPQKLKELQELFDAEAEKYNVFPLKDRTPFEHTAGGRARSAFGRANRIVLYPGTDHLGTFTGPQFQGEPGFKASSFSITAELALNSPGDEGVLFSTGNRGDGLSLFIQDSKFVVAHATRGKIRHLESDKPLEAGYSVLRFELNYAGDSLQAPGTIHGNSEESAGTATIFINNVKVGERNIHLSEAGYIASYTNDGSDIGEDWLTPVSDRYTSPFAFSGTLKRVVIEYK
jgi:arylsulfatase